MTTFMAYLIIAAAVNICLWRLALPSIRRRRKPRYSCSTTVRVFEMDATDAQLMRELIDKGGKG